MILEDVPIGVCDKCGSRYFDASVLRRVAKVGTGMIFDTLCQNAGHDIAVSDDSICGIAADRSPAAKKQFVICHHLNYFAADAGLDAMAGVSW